MKKWKNSVYFRLSKILCGFKDQVRARRSGEKCGLAVVIKSGGRERWGTVGHDSTGVDQKDERK